MNEIASKIQEAQQVGKAPAFSYGRVSSAEQQETGSSLEYQQDRARRYAAENNLYIVDEFIVQESAFRENRKEFNRMLELSEKFDVKNLIFKNSDRAARNEVDWPRLKKLAREKGYTIHLYELGTIFHENSTAESEMFLDNTAMLARYWSNKISQAVKKSYEFRAERGTPPGTPPIGYKYDHVNKCYTKDPETENIIETIFRMYDDEGRSVQDIVDYFDSIGFRTSKGYQLHKNPVAYILRNSIYAGFYQFKGKEYTATHEVYISREVYTERLQRMARKFHGTRKRTHDFPLSGVLRSGVTGRKLTGIEKKKRYIYYIHNRPSIAFTEPEAFRLIDAAFNQLCIKFNPEISSFIISEYQRAEQEQSRENSDVLKELTIQIDKCESDFEKISVALTWDGVDHRLINKQLQQITARKLELERKRSALSRVKKEFEFPEFIKLLLEIFKYSTFEPGAGIDVINKAYSLRQVVDYISLYDDHAELYFKKVIAPFLEPELIDLADKVLKSANMGAEITKFRTALARIIIEQIAA